MERKTVLIVDNVDPDNSLAAVVSCYPGLDLNLAAVIVTGRPAHPDVSAPINVFDQTFSEAVLSLNTRRMKGLLRRMGWHVPVFEGLIPPKTLVPHSVHIREELLDPRNDGHMAQADGTFGQALDFLRGLRGTIDFIIGGPLSEAREIMRDPGMAGKLGKLTCQLGLFGNVETIAGKGRTFNSAADPDATRAVLAEWPGPIYLVPTDVTKQPSVGFNVPKELEPLNVAREIVRLYEIFWRNVLGPRGEKIYPHDVHPVFLMAQLRSTLSRRPYTWKEVSVDQVSEHGEIEVTFGHVSSNRPKRFIVRTVDAYVFRTLLRACAQAR